VVVEVVGGEEKVVVGEEEVTLLYITFSNILDNANSSEMGL
jgi:hypothetical protein